MYRLKEIQKALFHVVGWEQNYNIDERIEEDLTQSESGLKYEDAHPLVTQTNIKAIMPQGIENSFAEWNDTANYLKGDIIRYNSACYIAIGNVVAEPPTNTLYWKKYNVLSNFLTRLINNAIATTVQKFIQEKQLVKETKNILENRCLFDGSGRLKATIMNTHKIVGFEITPVRAMGITTKIERVGLQLVGAVGVVKLYLFHSSKYEPIKVFNLDYTNTNGSFQWFKLDDCYMPYISEDNNSGGSWYLCYYQDELPKGAEAINFTKDWSREPCGTCNKGDLQTFRELSKYIQLSPFMAFENEFKDNPHMWDISQNIYTNTQNYGLNMEVTIGCDLTEFIISQRLLFANVLQRQMAYNVLRTIAMNPEVRVNRNQSNVSRMDVLYELNGKTDGQNSGLGYELMEDYKALQLDTQGIDRICLTCNNHGVKYTTV